MSSKKNKKAQSNQPTAGQHVSPLDKVMDDIQNPNPEPEATVTTVDAPETVEPVAEAAEAEETAEGAEEAEPETEEATPVMNFAEMSADDIIVQQLKTVLQNPDITDEKRAEIEEQLGKLTGEMKRTKQEKSKSVFVTALKDKLDELIQSVAKETGFDLDSVRVEATFPEGEMKLDVGRIDDKKASGKSSRAGKSVSKAAKTVIGKDGEEEKEYESLRAFCRAYDIKVEGAKTTIDAIEHPRKGFDKVVGETTDHDLSFEVAHEGEREVEGRKVYDKVVITVIR